MADELAVVHDILTIGKHNCEEVRRNIFVADRETAERLRNNCAELIIASCHPPGVKKGFVKGDAITLLRTNSNESKFLNQIENFKKRLLERGYTCSNYVI